MVADIGNSYADMVLKGVGHLEGHISNILDEKSCLKHIGDNTGDPFACIGELGMYSVARSMLAWFRDHEIDEFKNWAFVAAKIRRIVYQKRPKGNYGARDIMIPVVSDFDPLVCWFSRFEIPYSENGFYSNPERAARPNTPDFTIYQMLLALRGDWEELERRCLHFFEVSPPRRKSYFADQRFNLALARGDRAGMESAISELLEPKLMRRREADEGGYTKWFINTYAVIYTKIAWRHGYQIDVDSPWVPKEWLPIAPLDHYEDPYPFMRDFDINTPIEI